MSAVLRDALSGLTVLDFSQAIAGPYCACLLSDMGARVIKVEPPAGDFSRALGPSYGGASVAFNCFNRGKEGVVLDLKDKDGREAALKLAEQADIVIENNRPGVSDRLGIGYDALRARNPSLIYVSITGYGQTGPAAHRPANDSLMQAATGLSLGAGAPGAPVRVKLLVIDLSTGLYASNAVLAALIKRGRTGQGQHLDLSLMHASAAMQNSKIMENAVQPDGGPEELYPGIGIYATQDGHMVLSASREKHITGLMRLIGRGDLLEDPRFATADARMANMRALRDAIEASLRQKPTSAWLELFGSTDLLCAEVLDYPKFRADPQSEAVRLFTPVAFAGIEAPLPVVRTPGLGIDEQDLRPAPGLGADTLSVLLGAGVEPEVARRLANSTNT